MRKFIVVILALFFVAAMVAYMCTYTVRFTEIAVLTTFGRAGDNAIKTEPGLYTKLPYPVQNVTTYDRRVRFVQTRSETQQTADARQIIVEAFATWRVKDPLKFFQRFSNAGDRAEDQFRRAEENIRDSLRSALGVTSRFRMDQLFSIDDKGSKIPELETQVLEVLRSASAGGQTTLGDLGIEAVNVGINRILLPEDTTNKTMDAMIQNRQKLVRELESQGDSRAAAIRSKAMSDAQRIQAFARRRADEIRAQGDSEARQYFEQMNESPELAVFLRNVDFIKNTLSKRTTLVLPDSLPGFDMLSLTAMDKLRAAPVGKPSSSLPADGTLKLIPSETPKAAVAEANR
ncbi:MAG: hypothetical protein JSS51_01640 [Planctomycetes bacterium]|nr:hypothetical protein [Planctomycetota bacterium]